jgi:hypothetical protein
MSPTKKHHLFTLVDTTRYHFGSQTLSDPESAGSLILDFPALRARKKYICVTYNYELSGICYRLWTKSYLNFNQITLKKTGKTDLLSGFWYLLWTSCTFLYPLDPILHCFILLILLLCLGVIFFIRVWAKHFSVCWRLHKTEHTYCFLRF